MTIDLDDPVALMLAASTAFGHAGMEAAAYGGLALGMFGEVRETRDADLACGAVDAEAARKALEAIGVTVVAAFVDIQFGCVDALVAGRRRATEHGRSRDSPLAAIHGGDAGSVASWPAAN